MLGLVVSAAATVAASAGEELGLRRTAPWFNTRLTPDQRAAALLANMTLDEKVHMLHGSGLGYVGNVEGIDRLGVPALRLNDGPQGFRDPHHSGTSTQFPSGLTVAATWDVARARAWGVAMGAEFFAKGANVQLGPGVCVARVPHNGRAFEYISGEDPVLGAALVGPVIEGIQSTGGVIANVKHFVDNSQETQRMQVSEVVGEREQFELYYPPFEAAIHAGVGSLMCSYNKINGTYSCENPDTLQRDLKERLGYDGWVMSDWGATHSTSINAGLDMEMPAALYMGELLKLEVADGRINESAVDDSTRRVVTQMFKFGLFDIPNPNQRAANVTSQAHCDVARELASAAMVLLKNDGGVLPLAQLARGNFTVAVIGDQAVSPIVGGLGSGAVTPAHVVAPLWSLRNLLGLPQRAAAVSAVATRRAGRGTDTVGGGGGVVAPECNAAGACLIVAGSKDTATAVAAAVAADVAVVFLGTTSTEGVDRATLGFGGQDDALVEAVAAAANNTVVVAVAPGAFVMPWRDTVDAVLAPFMPGQEYGNAVVDVLTGKVNPSGKLPLTLPAFDHQVNFTKEQWPGVNKVATYSEGLLIGYRWYDAHNVEPAFPFGHGLSFTNFTYSNLTVTPPATTAEGKHTVAFTVTNAGAVTGAEVAQLYLGFPSTAGEPPRQLKGFQKVSLAAGDQAVVTLTLTARDRSVWDDYAHAWTEVAGTFSVFVGGSSRDTPLTARFTN